MRMVDMTLKILAIVFLIVGAILLYQGIGYSLVGNILGAIIFIIVGLILLFLGGLIVYGCFTRRKKSEEDSKKDK